MILEDGNSDIVLSLRTVVAFEPVLSNGVFGILFYTNNASTFTFDYDTEQIRDDAIDSVIFDLTNGDQ